ncbi:hypothetical protein AB6A40_008250 [Gnathostoma spinigerum]|uniref:Serine protease n=1 Tax=Gnathostoma spinigerum TaxID=75299 RepID=A0ABD6EQH3_9BILA
MTRSAYILCVVFLLSHLLDESASFVPKFFLGRHRDGFLEGTYRRTFGDQRNEYLNERVKNAYFKQKLDHFGSEKATWNQYYMESMEHHNGSEIAFLMIGGESPIFEVWLTDPSSSFKKLAKKYGAAMFQLEHRYFGRSRPLNDTRTENMKYCTIAQAIEDLAEFIKAKNKEKGFKKPRWVTFGGSYPGSLSAWFRSVHPELTVGAHSSSAPLQLELDFYEYTMVVEKVLNDTSKECYNRVSNGFHTMQEMLLTEEGRGKINKKFGLTPPFEKENVYPRSLQNFIANFFFLFAGVVQYTYDGPGSLGVDRLCFAINKSSNTDPLDPLRAAMDAINAVRLQTGKVAGEFDNDYWAMINELRNTSFNYEDCNSCVCTG